MSEQRKFAERVAPRCAARERAGGGGVVKDHRGFVRYLSPFAAAAWLPSWQANAYLEQDRRRWSKLEELGMVSVPQRSVGPPRIENN